MEDDFDFGAGGGGEAAQIGQEGDNEGFENLEEQQPSSSTSPLPHTPATTPPATQGAESSLLRRASSDAPMAPSAPSEATNKWKLENEKKIKQRDAEFAKTKAELAKKAEQALEKIRNERAQTIAKNAKANREAQAKAQSAAGSKSAPGAPVSWQKLAQLIDLEKETADRERMRLLFKAKVTEAKS